MTEEFCCPVCERYGLAPDCECCPQCDADLTCFQDLDRLGTKNAAPNIKGDAAVVPPNRFARIAMFACVFSAVIALVCMSFIIGRFEKRFVRIDKSMAVTACDKAPRQDVSTGRLHINQLKINYEGFIYTFHYHARKTDTLWGIARRFYGNGKYYPLIMEHNPHLVISDITAGRAMRIISDPDPAMLADMYREKTEWRNSMLLLRHVIQPGETRDSIYARFAAPGTTGQVFFDADAKIVPLEIIRIILR